MQSEWKITSLREAGVALIDCDHRTPPAAEDGYPYIAIPQIKQGHLDLTDARRIKHEHFLEWTKKAKPQSNDVVLSRRCNPGETAVVPDDLECALGQNLVLLRADGTKLFPPYLRWLVRSPEWWGQIGKFINAGAIFESLKCADIPNFRLPLAPLPEQRAITRILGSLDDKIELNRRMNATLETLAQTLFRAWFVDFEPVKAKAAGHAPLSLNAETAALFPSELEASALGRIPKGWKVAELPKEIDFLEGPGLRNWQYTDEGMKFLNIRCINDGDLDTTKATCISQDEYNQKYSHFALKENDIVISTSGTLGRSAIVRSDHLPVMLNTSIIRMRGIGSVGLAYTWGFLRSVYFLEEMFAAASGSVQLNFGPVHLRKIKMLRPPDAVLEAFERIAQPLLVQAAENRKQSRTLAQIRDALLPRLISGQLRVPDTEEV